MTMMDGYKLTMSFQLVHVEEVPIEALMEENAESVLETIKKMSAILDNIHDKAVHNIKWAQVKQAHSF